MAFKEVVLWAKSLDLNYVIFESDSLNIVKSITDATPYVNWWSQGIIEEIKHLLSSLSMSQISHVKRIGNKAAHNLASKARTERVSFVFWSIIPDWFADVVEDEEVSPVLCNSS